MADLSESAKAELEAGKKAKEASLKAFAEQTKGRPTPTQEENDRAKLGEHITEHEPDGSNEDPTGGSPAQREKAAGERKDMHSTATSSAGYRTRQSQAQSQQPDSPRAVYPVGKRDTTQTQMS